jgi:hypothetical protein
MKNMINITLTNWHSRSFCKNEGIIALSSTGNVYVDQKPERKIGGFKE